MPNAKQDAYLSVSLSYLCSHGCDILSLNQASDIRFRQAEFMSLIMWICLEELSIKRVHQYRYPEYRKDKFIWPKGCRGLVPSTVRGRYDGTGQNQWLTVCTSSPLVGAHSKTAMQHSWHGGTDWCSRGWEALRVLLCRNKAVRRARRGVMGDTE